MLDQIASFLQGHDRFAISTHMSPEGDALGSALATYWVLKQMGKQTVVVMHDPVPRNLEFLPGADAVLMPGELDEADYEQAILVDCANLQRVGNKLCQRFEQRFRINIDHHCDNTQFGNLNFVRDRASATIVLDEVFDALGVAPTPDIATCLYAGVMTDTNAFCNANVDAEVFAMATKWVRAGAKPHVVAQHILEQQSWNEIQLLGYALANAQLKDRVVWCALAKSDFERFNAHHHDTDAIVTQLRSVEGIEVAVLFKEIDKGKVKISLRAKGEVPVNGIAQHFGGGGHEKAAGCFVEGSLDRVVDQVLTHIHHQLAAFAG